MAKISHNPQGYSPLFRFCLSAHSSALNYSEGMHSSNPDPGLRISLEDPASNGTSTETPRDFTSRRRNRHGRGLRGPILHSGLPGSRTRAEKFDDLVVDSAARLRDILGSPLDRVEYLVEEVPEGLEQLIASGTAAPLGKYIPARTATSQIPANNAVVVIYRHPVETLCDSPWQLRELVHEVLIEQIAGLLNVDPDTVDPLFGRFKRGR